MNDPALYERLMAKVRKDASGCWLWTGPYHAEKPYPAHRYGYLSIWDRVAKVSRHYTTHRAMWIALHGKPAAGLCVCHRCDVPLCINPEHLFLGTHKENMADSRQKQRHYYASRTHCKNGHPLAGDNIYVIGPGYRKCKTCMRVRQRIAAGWSPEQATTLPLVAHGYRPVKGKHSRKLVPKSRNEHSRAYEKL